MVEGKDAFCCDIPYECSLEHKLLTQEKIDMDREDIGEVRFMMEYEGKRFSPKPLPCCIEICN